MEMDMTTRDYQKFKELLEQQEKFPLDYTVKLIGRNSDRFKDGLLDFQVRYPILKQVSSRASSGGANLAVTYSFMAQNADEIIALSEQASTIPDLLVML